MSRRTIPFLLALFLLAFFDASPATGQAPLTLQFEGFAPGEAPTVVHLAEVESALTRRRSWLPPVLVQADGTCEVELPARERLAVWQVAAPPWVWTVWQLPDAAAEDQTYVLRPHPRVARRLQDVPGLTSPLSAMHPMARRDSLQALADSLWSEVSYDIMLSAGAIAGGAALTDLVQIAAADSVFEWGWRQWASSFDDAPTVEDMLVPVRVAWQHQIGQSPEVPWRPESHGSLEAWTIRHAFWWERPDFRPDDAARAIAAEDFPALRDGMGAQWSAATEAECLAGWLLRAIVERDRLASAALDAFALPPFIDEDYRSLQDLRQLGKPGTRPPDLRWTTPSGDLESLDDFRGESWLVALVIQANSPSADAERQVFHRIAERFEDRRRDVKFVVLSIDGKEENWQSTLRARAGRKEQTRWLGAVPERWDEWGIASVPMVVTLDPAGRISRQVRSLPGQGLQQELASALR